MAKKRRKANLKNPNSATWKRKADKAWSILVRLDKKRCVICGKLGLPTIDGLSINGLQSHHLIGRAVLKYRYDFMNGVSLCLSCHGAMPDRRNRRCCAHGTGEVFERFCTELRVRQPEQYDWWQVAKEDKRPEVFTYKEAFEKLEADIESLKVGRSDVDQG